jgi:hypothetical protein
VIILVLITVVFQIALFILLKTTTVTSSTNAGVEELGIRIGQPAELLDNTDQKAAATSCDHPLACADLPPPSHLVSGMSPKARVDTTSQV